MSTVHKHFPIMSYPGSIWGQGPQVVFHVSNPLWGIEKKGWREGFEKQFERKSSESSHVQTSFFSFSLKLLLTSFFPLWQWRWLQAARHHRYSSTSVIILTMDGGSFGSPRNRSCQAFQGRLLITPSGRVKSRSPESPYGSMLASRGSPVRRVEVGVLALTHKWNDLLSERF